MAKAVVLLSGGLDSSTVLAIAAVQGYELVALTFDYGQKHAKELESARKVARHFAVREHIVMGLDLGRFADSSLTRKDLDVPDGKPNRELGGIPTTYVPGRNIVFLSVASSLAESIGADAVFIAANAVDFSGYPDCTPEFMGAFQRVLEVGTKVGVQGRPVRIETPIIDMSKADIVREAVRLRVPLESTWSCYRGGTLACGKCDSCLLRIRGFEEAGVIDPIRYEVRK